MKWLYSKLDIAEQRLSKLEDRCEEIIQYMAQSCRTCFKNVKQKIYILRYIFEENKKNQELMRQKLY